MTNADLPVVSDRPVQKRVHARERAVVAETADVPARRSTNAPVLAEALQSASDYAKASKSAATRRAYKCDWADFAAWCERAGAIALPAEPAVLASYLAQLADRGKKVSTIRRRLAAIAYAHRLKGLPLPGESDAVRAVLAGIRRTVGVAVSRKAPATALVIARAIAARQPDRARGGLRFLRDQALLLLGFAAALRRSELVALDIADLEFSDRGVIVAIRSSKTDQEAEGAFVAVPNGRKLKPVAALRAWLDALARASGLQEGVHARERADAGASALPKDAALFRSIDKGGRIGGRLSGRSVANIVKDYAAAAGFDDAIYSGHSMRAGFVTNALERGADFFAVMQVTRHRDVDTLRAYDRRAGLFKDHAGKDFL